MTIADKPILLLVGIIIVLSCSKTPAKWTKDYYDYQMGAIINGEEFHEAYQFLLGPYGKEYGFQMYYLSIEGNNMVCVSWKGGDRYFYSNPKKKGLSYSFHFDIFYDIEINDASCLNFIGLADTVNTYNIWRYPDSFYHGIPLVQGSLWGDENYYQIIEGSIDLGRFRNDVNIDQVSFNFIAESDSGERLVVEDGYCKAYSNRGVYE